MKTGAVCAIVVTHNRQELLRECLHALLRQTVPVEKILVIDNASTDGTPAMLAREFPFAGHAQLELQSLPQNLGGAGGFHEGLLRAGNPSRASGNVFPGLSESSFSFTEKRQDSIPSDRADYEWFWLMDDDTIPSADALEQLLQAVEKFPPGQTPEIVASRVVWNDGTLHPMNMPAVKLGDIEGTYLAAERGTVSVRSATFVSLMIHSRAVTRHGLPMADYFIWGDDIEYTGRILREGIGVLVPASLALHKTATKYGPAEGSAARFYYFVRNNLWMILWSSAWTRGEKFKLVTGLIRGIGYFLRHTAHRGAGIKSIARGFLDAFSRRPQQ